MSFILRLYLILFTSLVTIIGGVLFFAQHATQSDVCLNCHYEVGGWDSFANDVVDLNTHQVVQHPLP